MQNKKYNLLYINVDKTNLGSFKKDFHRDFNIFTAESVIDGLRILTKDGMHLVILDYQLPEASGLKFLKEVKNKYPDIRCILLTDHDDIKMFGNSFDSINLWRIILKPYEVKELTAVMKNALENYQLKIDKDKLLNELKFRAERYEKMMDTSMDSIITINDKQEITEANKAACELFGYNLTELIGSPLSILIPENKRKTHPKLVRSFSNCEQSQLKMGYDTYRYGLSSSGKKIPIEVTLSKQIMEQGNFYNAFIRDVSKRLKREQRINESESKLREAQQIAKLGHWEYDISNKKFYWSDEMYRILGMAPKAVAESSKIFYDRVHPDDRESTRKSYYDSVETKQTLDINYRLKLPDGQIKHVHEKCVTHYDKQGKAFRSIGTLQDITKQVLAEQKIKESELKLKEALQIAKIGHWELDIINNKLNWSDDIHRIFEIKTKKTELTYQDFLDNIHPDDREMVDLAYTDSLKTRKPYTINHRIQLKDGRIKHVNEKCVTMFDEHGEPLRSSGTIQDITKQINSEIALKKSEKQFRELYEKSGDAILIIKNETFTDCNKATINMIGFKSKEEFLNTHPSKLSPKIQPDGLSSFEKAEEMMRIALEQGTHRFEWAHTKSNGEDFPVEVLLTVISNEPDNRVIHCVWRDITDRKKAEEIIIENNLQFSQLANHTSDVFWLGDVSDMENIKWLYVNPAFEHVWQQTAEAIYQDPAVWYNAIHEEDRERLGTAFIDFLHEKRKGYDQKFRIVRPDKTVRHIHATGNLIKDSNGKITRVAGISRDVTVQKKDEVMIAQRTAELEESLAILEGKNFELEQFAYISSHDLQEPLSTVSSFAELLDQEYRGKLDNNADTYLQFILDSTSRMRNLIHGLLEYSILGKGRTAERVDCNEILKLVLEDLQGVISEKQGKVESELLPTLNAHPIEMKQLFENLISNALKYCREGVLPVINISSRKQNGTCEFKFKDNGIGIDEKFYEKIFVIFQRLHNNQDYEGTGIGLAHCRKIVELHNGRIWVESIPNKGSEFYFTIKM